MTIPMGDFGRSRLKTTEVKIEGNGSKVKVVGHVFKVKGHKGQGQRLQTTNRLG